METLKVEEKDLKDKIGSGMEGYVYSYKGKYAVKIFRKFQWNFGGRTIEKLNRKMAKVGAMMSLKDPGAAFPLGFAELPNDDDIAYYMKKVYSPSFDPYTKNLSDLWYEEYDEKVECIILKADETLQRIHKLGVAIGDIKETNILLEGDTEPVYVDLDNAVYQDYPFDTYPIRASYLRNLFGGRETAYQDNDKLVFALLALYMKTKDGRFFRANDRTGIRHAINHLEPDKEAKEILNCIFSDAENKPYIGSVFSRIRKRH